MAAAQKEGGGAVCQAAPSGPGWAHVRGTEKAIGLLQDAAERAGALQVAAVPGCGPHTAPARP
eukprot:8606020-Lingulodinium_polyedra.AAC.1